MRAIDLKFSLGVGVGDGLVTDLNTIQLFKNSKKIFYKNYSPIKLEWGRELVVPYN